MLAEFRQSVLSGGLHSSLNVLCSLHSVLSVRCFNSIAGEHGAKWQNTKVFPTYQALLEDADAKPTAAFIGLPPKYHGSLEDPKANIEVYIQSTLHMLWISEAIPC